MQRLEEVSGAVGPIYGSLGVKRLNYFFGIKLYVFRTVPLSIIKIFSLYAQQCYMSYRFADSLQAGSGRSVLILLASCML